MRAPQENDSRLECMAILHQRGMITDYDYCSEADRHGPNGHAKAIAAVMRKSDSDAGIWDKKLYVKCKAAVASCKSWVTCDPEGGCDPETKAQIDWLVGNVGSLFSDLVGDLPVWSSEQSGWYGYTPYRLSLINEVVYAWQLFWDADG